jgi:hypothetical protein
MTVETAPRAEGPLRMLVGPYSSPVDCDRALIAMLQKSVPLGSIPVGACRMLSLNY